MWLVWLISWLTLAACARREKDLVARAETVLAAARSLTAEALPPAQGIAEGNANMLLVLLAALFRAHHGLERAAAALSGHMSQFAQWLEEYDVQVSEATLCKSPLKSVSLMSTGIHQQPRLHADHTSSLSEAAYCTYSSSANWYIGNFRDSLSFHKGIFCSEVCEAVCC